MVRAAPPDGPAASQDCAGVAAGFGAGAGRCPCSCCKLTARVCMFEGFKGKCGLESTKRQRFVYIAHKQTARSPTTPSARRVTAVLLILAARRPRTAAVPPTPPRWAAPATAVLRADRALAVGAAPPRAARQAVPLEDVDVARPSAGLRCVACARRRAERVVDFRRALHRIAAPAFVAVLDADVSRLGGGVGPA